MKISRKRYIQGFCVIVVALGWVKAIFPSVAYNTNEKVSSDTVAFVRDTIAEVQAVPGPEPVGVANPLLEEEPFTPHRIYSVASFKNSFPDQNDVQLVAAQKYGVKPVASQADAEKRKDVLVFIGSNPYYYVDRLNSSIPYLVPKAAVLLQDIGKTFFDSLQVKGVPLHKIIVTSALRSKEDVARLQRRNQNATTNSCHQYGTTIDICYNRYKTVQDPEGPQKRAVTNDTLKWVLSEVLNDFRKNDRCYIKYEVKQGCFHLTVR